MIRAVVVGAGPFGLSIAAHLKHGSIEHRVFGRPVETWSMNMPKGMNLKSDGFASNLALPHNKQTLLDYCRSHGLAYDDPYSPITLATFVDYAKTAQAEHLPWLEQQAVRHIERSAEHFVVTLDDGTTFPTRAVVLAVGITHFAKMHPALRDLPDHVASHSSQHHDLSRFSGKRVAIVGAGASAVGLAALLNEAGAKATLICRRQNIHFTSAPGRAARSLWQSLRHPSSGLGPGLRSRLACDFPNLFRYLPARFRLKIVNRHLGPSSPWYLKPRIDGKVLVLCGKSIKSAAYAGNDIQLTLAGADGASTEQTFDHVISATGYEADVDRLDFLDGDLRRAVRRCGKMPDLSAHFESSVKGLYFTGLAASGSFGPLMRFMYGSSFAAKRIASHLSKGL